MATITQTIDTSEPQTEDMQAFCTETGFQLIESVFCEDEYTFLIRKNCHADQAA